MNELVGNISCNKFTKKTKWLAWNIIVRLIGFHGELDHFFGVIVVEIQSVRVGGKFKKSLVRHENKQYTIYKHITY